MYRPDGTQCTYLVYSDCDNNKTYSSSMLSHGAPLIKNFINSETIVILEIIKLK